MNKTYRLLLLAALLLLLVPDYALAYIGPGAGFALAGSFLAVFAAFFSAVVLLVTWPIRMLLKVVLKRGPPANARFKRIVILGLDGLDHGLTQKLLDEGKLPNLAKLREQGCFKSLGSTVPPISPVAWSSFQTGTNPGKHNIFDFLTPDLHSYQAKLSSVEIKPPRRMLRFGKYQFPLGKGSIRLMRKSKPFWVNLSERGIFNAILRVPITFPAEKLRGVTLSAMCVPDLRGTQGMFSHFTSRTKPEGEKIGGEVHPVTRNGKIVKGELIGPPNPFFVDGRVMKLPFTVTIKDANHATLKINGNKHELTLKKYTEWLQVYFTAAPMVKVYGVCKFMLLNTDPQFDLYCTPINLDPENPAMPIGYPSVYSMYLAKKQGSFATLGLAEDTWALNEHVLEDEHFLQQCIDFDIEREAMWFDSLDKVKTGLCVCVFDGSDRIQHMFWRYHDEQHPARCMPLDKKLGNPIENLYVRMDELVGKTMAKCTSKDNLLMVISDHGFNTFRRGVDLNRWLEENGYLKVDDAKRNQDHLGGVDWSQTRAFAIGLTGVFINVKGKYSQGIVEPGAEADKLREEIAAKLGQLVDPQNGASAIKRVYISPKFYRGPYKDAAPDLIPGWQRGYRISWESAIGKTSKDVFHDNTKAWSGDHCVDPSVVPGILFCNQPVLVDNPRLLDIAPTVLQLFGVNIPEYMDGKPWNLGNGANGVTKEQIGIPAKV